MNITGNTILITGGGSGIGRGLAEALQAEGNQVIIAGRRQQTLDEVTSANPGMKSLVLDVENSSSIRDFAKQIEAQFPALNMLMNNAGISRPETLQTPPDDLADAEAMVTTNLLGPMRLTAALLPLLKAQEKSAIINVSSGLAFVPLATHPTYCATKAALHSYTQSLRYQLRATSIEVLEIIPPYVQTELGGKQQASDPNAMPLDDFIAETIDILKTQPTPTEICVQRGEALYRATESGNYAAVFQGMNAAMGG